MFPWWNQSFSAVVNPLHSNHDHLIGLLTPVPKYFRAKIHTFFPRIVFLWTSKHSLTSSPMWGFQTTRMLNFMRPFSVYFSSHYNRCQGQNLSDKWKTSVTQHSRKTTLKFKHFDGADFKPALKRLFFEGGGWSAGHNISGSGALR